MRAVDSRRQFASKERTRASLRMTRWLPGVLAASTTGYPCMSAGIGPAVCGRSRTRRRQAFGFCLGTSRRLHTGRGASRGRGLFIPAPALCELIFCWALARSAGIHFRFGVQVPRLGPYGRQRGTTGPALGRLAHCRAALQDLRRLHLAG